ncbi:hypothetical protein [Kribbella sp. NPDC051770]|uniref:hypothetical protein n=1 Tax=Kribbella sp. NPDC051770 TaxID=3155413 RepID=UPI003435F312
MKLTPAQPGHVVGASFGLVFILANSAKLGSPGRAIVGAVAIAAALLVLVAFVQLLRAGGPRKPQQQSGRGYFAIVAAEVVLLFGGLAVLNRVEPTAAVGWVALVVGLHFMAFAYWWMRGNREMLAIGVLMSVLGVIGLVIAFAQQDRPLVGLVAGVGSGVVLLGNAVLASLGVVGSEQRAAALQ